MPVATDCDRHICGRDIMIQTVLGILLILLHIVCCVLVWMGIKTHFLKVKKYLIGLVVFVPFWGTICVLLLHLQRLTKRDNRIEPGVEKLRVNEEIYKNIFQAASDMDQKCFLQRNNLLIHSRSCLRNIFLNLFIHTKLFHSWHYSIVSFRQYLQMHS